MRIEKSSIFHYNIICLRVNETQVLRVWYSSIEGNKLVWVMFAACVNPIDRIAFLRRKYFSV